MILRNPVFIFMTPEIKSSKRVFPESVEYDPIAIQHGLERIYVIKFSEDKNIFNLISKLEKDPSVEYAEPNYIAKVAWVPNDPYFDNFPIKCQWGLYNDNGDCFSSRRTMA